MFDHVVVGAGSSGCIVAAKLAERGHRVLLLEAGPGADEAPETLAADGYKDAFINDEIIWERFSEPQPHLNDGRVFMGSGSVVGGSGAVNGMVYTRGAKEDYAEWPEGWRWDDVVPHFEALEKQLSIHRRAPTEWTRACVAGAVSRGFEEREDLNDGQLSNAIGYEWMSYAGDRRRSSYVAFVRDRWDALSANLTIETRAKLLRIGFDGRRATTIRYRQGEAEHEAAVAGEVILCAGALETPKLLMLSGVGPGGHLREHGIEVVVDVPSLGENLHDHPNVPVFFRCKTKVDCKYPQLYSFFRTHPEVPLPPAQSDTCYVFWPAPSAMKEAVQRMLPAQVLPPKLYHSPFKQAIRGGVELAFKSGRVRDLVDHLYGIVVILGKPQSRGQLRLASADPLAQARIDPRYLSHPQDMETMVKGVRLARQIAESPALAAIGSSELMPGRWVESDEAIASWVAKNAITTYHFAGTCRMGTDAASVVDTELRVRGLDNVRVADASAVPVTPVSALNAPSMLIGLRAAELVGARN